MKEKIYVTIRRDEPDEVELKEYDNIEFTFNPNNGLYCNDNLLCSVRPGRRVYLAGNCKHIYCLYFDDLLYFQVSSISSKPPKTNKAQTLVRLRKRYLKDIEYIETQYKFMKGLILETKKGDKND